MGTEYCFYCMRPMAHGSMVCGACGRSMPQSVPPHHLKYGTILRGKYYIGKAIGEGGFGITYLGRDLTLDVRIAVKEYFLNGCSNRNNTISNEVTTSFETFDTDYETDMNRFLSEARILARFYHEPGVVSVRDFFQDNGTAYIVMEYLDGITLKKFIQTRGCLEPNQMIAMIEPMLRTLAGIHKQGLIHRDISPDNIMVLNNGQLKLLDFGSAREIAGNRTLSVMLKPGYAPEEQYRSKGDQGPWTDVYAMCATIYKCITGITPEESIQRVFTDGVKPPSQLGISILPAYEETLMRGLAIYSWERIQNMDALRNAFLTGKCPTGEVETQEQSFEETESEEEKPKRVKLMLVAWLLLAMVLFAALGLYLFQQGKDSPDSKSSTEQQISQKPDPMEPVPVPTYVAEPGVYGYTLRSLGAIEDPERSLRIEKDALLQIDGEIGVLLNYLGEKENDLILSAVSYLGDGLYQVSSNQEEVNCVGLVDRMGQVLIPCEACAITWLSSDIWTSSRYLLVAYATGETNNRDECFVYTTESAVSIRPNEGDKMYTGYGRIYDLQQQRFVEGVTIHNQDRSATRICGNGIFVTERDGNSVLYDSEGQTVFQSSYPIQVGNGIFIEQIDTVSKVYDESGLLLRSIEGEAKCISGSGGYFCCSAGEDTVIYDRSGNETIRLDVAYVYSEDRDVFKIGNGTFQGLVRADGRILLSCEQYQNIILMENGFYYGSVSVDGGYLYSLIGSEGVIVEGLSAAPNGLKIVKDDSAFVINDRSYGISLEDSSPETLEFGLLCIQGGEEDRFGLYDLFTGRQLLFCEYDRIVCAAGYVYAYRNEEWQIFELIGPEN